MGHGFQISQTRLKPELIQGDPLTVQNPSWRLLEHPRASPKIPELNGYKWRFVAGKINDQGAFSSKPCLITINYAIQYLKQIICATQNFFGNGFFEVTRASW